MNPKLPAIRGVKTMYDWQMKCAIQWNAQQHDEYGVRGLAVEAITGTGKTFASLICAKMWFEKHAILARLIVVVPTEALQKQWYGIIRQTQIANVARRGGGHQYDGFAPIVVVVQNSLKTLIDHKNFTDKKVLFILDEAHRAASKGTLTWLKKFRQQQKMQGAIAISATMARADGGNILDITGSIEGKPHVSIGYAQAIEEGIIPPFRIHVYELTALDLTWQEDAELSSLNKQIAIAWSEWKKDPNFNHNIFARYNEGIESVEKYKGLTRKRKRIINDCEARYTLAHELMMEYAGAGSKVALFHETINGVERISDAAIEAGLDKPYIYHSGQTPDDWDELTQAQIKKLKDYERNRKKILAKWVDPRTEGGVLLTVKALKEGLDVPEMDALVMLSHPNNPTPLLQATGRALRGNKDADGNWVDRHGNYITKENPKNIYIVVQAGTTDANCIPNMKDAGNIPDELFTTYRRNIQGVWIAKDGQHTTATQSQQDIDESFDDVIVSANAVELPMDFDDEPVELPMVFDDEPVELPMVFDEEDTPALEFNAITGEMQPKMHKEEEVKTI